MSDLNTETIQTTKHKNTVAEKTAEPKQNKRAKTKTVHTAAKPIEFIPVSVGTSQLVKQYHCTHAGLMLGKYASVLSLKGKRLNYELEVEQKKRILQRGCRALATSKHLKSLWQTAKQERNNAFKALNVQSVFMSSISPVVLQTHQTFQDEGLYLDPVYGTPIFPGDMIKGILKKHAYQTWLPQQSDPEVAQVQLDTVFGSRTQQGNTIFYDAWPANWASLIVDVNANHYQAYYKHRHAPGDYYSPEADYFLALKPGSLFSFSFGQRQIDAPQESMALIKTWLSDCLTEEGLGSFRHSGYGLWKSPRDKKTITADQSYALKLVSPGFFSGAFKEADSCLLRSTSLRGSLRFWWRTLHAGYLDVKTLNRLEYAVWGGPHKPGGVTLWLEPQQPPQARRLRWPDLARQLPMPTEHKHKGLDYLLHGLSEDHRKTYFLQENSKWKLNFKYKTGLYKYRQQKARSIEISPEMIASEVKSALWLLLTYGGLGSRHRKGFGSLQVSELEWDLDASKAQAQILREHCGLRGEYTPEKLQSGSLNDMLQFEIKTPWKNPWFTLHQVGSHLQSFALEHKHKAEKMALGLPRHIGKPVKGKFKAGAPVKNRHASPLQVHLKENEEGTLSLNFSAFPSHTLPDFESSQSYLKTYLAQLQSSFEETVSSVEETKLTYPLPASRNTKGRENKASRPGSRPQEKGENKERPRKPFKRKEAGEDRKQGQGPTQKRERFERKERPGQGRSERPASGKFGKGRPTAPSKPKAPQAGQRIEAILLEEKTKKGGWKAKEERSKLSGPIVNSALIPGDSNPGDKVPLMIHAVNKFEMLFRWPTAADDQIKAPKKKAKTEFEL